MIAKEYMDRVPLDTNGQPYLHDVTTYLKSLASWLEQLPDDEMLVNLAGDVCYIDNPHVAASFLRIFLPAESRA